MSKKEWRTAGANVAAKTFTLCVHCEDIVGSLEVQMSLITQ